MTSDGSGGDGTLSDMKKRGSSPSYPPDDFGAVVSEVRKECLRRRFADDHSTITASKVEENTGISSKRAGKALARLAERGDVEEEAYSNGTTWRILIG